MLQKNKQLRCFKTTVDVKQNRKENSHPHMPKHNMKLTLAKNLQDNMVNRESEQNKLPQPGHQHNMNLTLTERSFLAQHGEERGTDQNKIPQPVHEHNMKLCVNEESRNQTKTKYHDCY